MSIGWGIATAVLLLAVNAFFVGAEFALISARRSALEPRATSSRAARVTIRAMENVSLMMAGAQLGITICSLGLGALGEPAVAAAIEPAFAALGVPESLLHPVAFVLALALVVFLHVTVGEMVPKNIALAVPERAALVLAPPLVAVVAVLRPFLRVLNGVANLVLRTMRVTPRNEMASTFSGDEVAGLVEQSRREGLLDAGEADLVLGALTFAERTVDSVAVGVGELVTVDARDTVAQVEAAAHRAGSRLPVRGPAGDLAGYVHVKDLLTVPTGDRGRPLPREKVRDLAVLAGGTGLAEALAVMRRERAHLALVAPPGGGSPTGAVTLDDVLAALVGQVPRRAR